MSERQQMSAHVQPAWHVAQSSGKQTPQRSIGVWEHPPVPSQASAVQTSPSSQPYAAPGTQVPVMQASLAVHEFPSSHVVPSGIGRLTHAPVEGSHCPGW